MSRHLAIDQSYARPGFAVVEDKKILYFGSLTFKNKTQNWEKRIAIGSHAFSLCEKYEVSKVIVEGVRLFSSYTGKNGKKKNGISLDTILALAKINGQIICSVAPLGIPIYSADTKTWKNAMLHNVPIIQIEGVPPEKAASIWYIKNFYNVSMIEHDEAEACLIGLYSFDLRADLKKET